MLNSTGRLKPEGRTPGGHRRYDRRLAARALGREDQAQGILTLAYARVSSHDKRCLHHTIVRSVLLRLRASELAPERRWFSVRARD